MPTTIKAERDAEDGVYEQRQVKVERLARVVGHKFGVRPHDKVHDQGEKEREESQAEEEGEVAEHTPEAVVGQLRLGLRGQGRRDAADGRWGI
jgi:hypothetical protein